MIVDHGPVSRRQAGIQGRFVPDHGDAGNFWIFNKFFRQLVQCVGVIQNDSGVDEQYDGAVRAADADIAGIGRPSIGFKIDQGHVEPFADFPSAVGGTVIDDDGLKIGVVLICDAIERFRHYIRAVICRYYNADA